MGMQMESTSSLQLVQARSSVKNTCSSVIHALTPSFISTYKKYMCYKLMQLVSWKCVASTLRVNNY